jgi:hypothetical protein
MTHARQYWRPVRDVAAVKEALEMSQEAIELLLQSYREHVAHLAPGQ